MSIADPAITLLERALARRAEWLTTRPSDAFRAFSPGVDGLPGIVLDVYGPGAVLMVYEGIAPRTLDVNHFARAALDVLATVGVRALYHKPFPRDRSKLGGTLPAVVTLATPLAGEPLPSSIIIREHDYRLEVRLYDGLSTGLFLDQRANRHRIATWAANAVAKKRERRDPPHLLNTFAYTCAFSVAAAKAGVHTTSVDVSGRYLDWGKRNFAHSDIDVQAPPVDSSTGASPTMPAKPLSPHRFAKMDTFEFLSYAQRKQLRYDCIVLDPPSFAAANKRKGIPAWSATADYARLVGQAATLLAPKGVIVASTNTQELCMPGRLEREIVKGLAKADQGEPRWLKLPPPPPDFSGETGRFQALAFTPARAADAD